MKTHCINFFFSDIKFCPKEHSYHLLPSKLSKKESTDRSIHIKQESELDEYTKNGFKTAKMQLAEKLIQEDY